DYPNAPCWGGPDPTTANGMQDPGPNCATSGTQDVSGRPMPNSPKFKGTLSLDQRIPLSAGPFDLAVGGTYSYRSSAQMLPDQNPQAIQPAFGLLNMYASLKDKAGKYSLTLFANNVTNHVYYGDVEDFWTGPWGSNAVVAQPA